MAAGRPLSVRSARDRTVDSAGHPQVEPDRSTICPATDLNQGRLAKTLGVILWAAGVQWGSDLGVHDRCCHRAAYRTQELVGSAKGGSDQQGSSRWLGARAPAARATTTTCCRPSGPGAVGSAWGARSLRRVDPSVRLDVVSRAAVSRTGLGRRQGSPFPASSEHVTGPASLS